MDKLMPLLSTGTIGDNLSLLNTGHLLKKAKLTTLVTALLMLKLIQMQESLPLKSREKSRSK